MSPTAARMIGFLFIVAAVAVAILNLKRVAALGMPWLAPIFLILGAGLVAASRGARR
jgi:hypothetical protein